MDDKGNYLDEESKDSYTPSESSSESDDWGVGIIAELEEEARGEESKESEDDPGELASSVEAPRDDLKAENTEREDT